MSVGGTQLAAARERGIAFAATRGDELARRRAAALASRQPVAGVLRCLGDPGDAGGSAGLVSALSILDDLRALHERWVQAASAILEREQRPDGSWGDDGVGDAERSFRTGMLAGHLGKTRWARPALLEAAADHLAERFAPERVQGFAWRAIWSHAHLFSNVPHDAADAVLQWCGRELERGHRAGTWSAVATARVFVTCDAMALPGARLSPDELVVGVLGEQQPDGGWPDPDSASVAARVERSLDALAALCRLCP